MCLYPRLHQTRLGQQCDGGNRPPLFCPHEAPPAELHPGQRAPAQKACRAVEVGPEEGNKDAWRAGAPPL